MSAGRGKEKEGGKKKKKKKEEEEEAMRRRSSAVCFLPAFCQPPLSEIFRGETTYKEGARFRNRQQKHNTMRDGEHMSSRALNSM